MQLLRNYPSASLRTFALHRVQIRFMVRLTTGKLLIESNKYRSAIEVPRGLVMAIIARDHVRAMSAHGMDNLYFFENAIPAFVTRRIYGPPAHCQLILVRLHNKRTDACRLFRSPQLQICNDSVTIISCAINSLSDTNRKAMQSLFLPIIMEGSTRRQLPE